MRGKIRILAAALKEAAGGGVTITSISRGIHRGGREMTSVRPLPCCYSGPAMV